MADDDLKAEAHRIVAAAFDIAVQYLPVTAGAPPALAGQPVSIDLDHARDQLSALQRATAVLDAQLLDRQLAHVELDARTGELERLHDEMAATVRRARADLVVRTDELEDLARRVASTDEHLRTLNLRIADQQQTIDDIHHDLAEARRRITAERDLLQRLEQQVTERASAGVSHQARIDQSRAELTTALTALADVASTVEQLTDLVEHDDLAGRATDELGKVTAELTSTVEHVATLTEELASSVKQPDQDGVDVGDLMLHLYTTVAGTMTQIQQRISAVLDLHDRLSAIATDPDATPRLDPTGGRVEGRNTFLKELRSRAAELATPPSPARTINIDLEAETDRLFGED